MTNSRQRTGVAILRLENQSSGLLISLRVNADITELSRERETKFASTEEALDAIRGFVQSFVGSANFEA